MMSDKQSDAPAAAALCDGVYPSWFGKRVRFTPSEASCEHTPQCRHCVGFSVPERTRRAVTRRLRGAWRPRQVLRLCTQRAAQCPHSAWSQVKHARREVPTVTRVCGTSRCRPVGGGGGTTQQVLQSQESPKAHEKRATLVALTSGCAEFTALGSAMSAKRRRLRSPEEAAAYT
jgi:hypothetical protein